MQSIHSKPDPGYTNEQPTIYVDPLTQPRSYSSPSQPLTASGVLLVLPVDASGLIIGGLTLLSLMLLFWLYRLYRRNQELQNKLHGDPEQFINQFEGIADTCLITFQNSRGELMLVNKEFEELLGLGPDDIFSKSPSDLPLSAEMHDLMLRGNSKVLKNQDQRTSFRELVELHEPGYTGRYMMEKRLFQLGNPGGSYVLTTLVKIDDKVSRHPPGLSVKKEDFKNRKNDPDERSGADDQPRANRAASDRESVVIFKDQVEQVVGYYPVDVHDEPVMELVKSSITGRQTTAGPSDSDKRADLKLVSGGGSTSQSQNTRPAGAATPSARKWDQLSVEQEEDSNIEQGFEFLAEFMNDIVAMLDADGKMLWVSPSVEHVLGYKPTEWKGLRFFDLIHPEDAERLERRGGSSLFTRSEVQENRIVYRVKHADGSYRWLETIAKPLYGENGRARRIVTTSRDITDRKQTELRTQESEDLLRIMLEQSPNAMAMLDRKGHLQLASKSWESWFDLEGRDISDQPIWEVLPVDRKKWASLLNRCREGHIQELEEWFSTPSGHYSVEWSLHPWYASDGEIAGIMVFARSNEAKRDVTDQSAEVPAMIRQRHWSETFLVQLSHALRTPLNGIHGYAQLLQQGSPLTENDVTNYADGLMQSSEQLQQVIEDLLQLYDIESEPASEAEDEIELKPLIDDLAQMYRQRAERKNVLFNKPCVSPSLKVAGSGDDLRKVLVQLTDNAVTYTDTGSVSIEVDTRPAVTTKSETDREVVIRLRDTGCGIASEELDNIRKPFYRIDHNNAIGSGLGLTLADHLIERMGGSLHIDSRPYMGTTVTIALPSAGVTAPQQKRADQNKPTLTLLNEEGPLRALIVDDLKHNRLISRVMLEQLGFECIEADNGLEAVRMLEEKLPDVVLMDQIMPVMNGDSAVKKIREKFPEVAIIAVTGSTGTGGRDWFLERGFDDYLQKPYPMVSLEQKLHKIFPDHLVERKSD